MTIEQLRKKKIALRSIGCRTNQEEVAELHAELDRRGLSIVEEIEDADCIILNSCSVTLHAESKTRRLLSALAREVPHVEILVTGCYAQQKAAELLACPNVKWVVGNASKHEIPDILLREGGLHAARLDARAVPVPQIIDPPTAAGRTRFHLKIQEGCDRRCAFCIVPFLRGPSRSAGIEAIDEACRRAVDAGYKEVVLTGTHIGQYRDVNGARLIALVERLLRIEGVFRLRLSSIDAEEVSEDLLAMVGEGKKLCDHLHLSLQSLAAGVLERMGRPFRTLDATMDKFVRFRERFPFAGLGADFIVGFPGETDALFEETFGNAEEIGFSYAHIFRYSKRPGTAAAAFSPVVPESVKKERSERLGRTIARSAEAFIAEQVGHRRRIIVEKGCPVRGITSNYLTVTLPEISVLPNSWIDVIIDEHAPGGRKCFAHPPGQEELWTKPPTREVRER